MLNRSPNGHLHLALLVALVAASLVALATPIASTRASDEGVGTSRIPAAGTGLAGPAGSAATGNSRLIPQPLMTAALGVALGHAFQAPDTAMATEGPHPAVRFTLHEDGFASVQVSSGATVGEALTGLGINLSSADLVSPGTGDELAPGMHVYLDRALSVRLSVGGEPRVAYTRAQTVRDFLAEAGVVVEPMDRVFPGIDAMIEDGMRVNVTTVRDVLEVIDDPIAFDTVYEYDPDLEDGRQLLVQEGAEGDFHREYLVRRVDGVEIGRQTVSETILPPTDEVVSIGTYVEPAPAPEPVQAPVWLPPAPAGPVDCAGTLNVYATWYTAASAGGNGWTATGVQVQHGVVAVDPSVIPLGTRMYIPGYGFGVAADTGGGIIGNMIDLGFGANDVYDWRTQWLDICILG